MQNYIFFFIYCNNNVSKITNNIMTKKKTLFIVALLAAVTACGQDTLWMSLDSCIAYAYRHNINIQTTQLNQQSAAASYEGAKWRFAPSVSASASQSLSLNHGTSSLDGNYGVNANMTLFNGLNNVYNLRSARITQEQSALKVQQTLNDIGSQIITAYLTIMMNQERLLYQEEVLKTAQQQQQEGELKYSVGKMLESDYHLLVANSITAQSNITDTRITIQNNQLALRTLLCMDDNVTIGILEDFTNTLPQELLPTLDTALAFSLRNLPDLYISQKDVELAQLNVKMAQANFMPTLGLNAGANYYDGNSGQVSDNGTLVTSGGINSSVSLNLSIPILNRGTSHTQYKQSKIQLEQSQLQHDQTFIDLKKKVEGQYLNLMQSLNKYHSSQVLESAYKDSYEVYVIKYAQGAVTTVEMLQQQDKYLSANADYLQNKYNYILEQKILDIYMNSLR